MKSKKYINDKIGIIYDPSLVGSCVEHLFDRDRLKQLDRSSLKSGGRADVLFYQYDNYDLVLKHYRRGGFFAKICHDTYFGNNPERSRSWNEWKLLDWMFQRDLPVPRPVAAQVQQGFFHYRADLITERIVDSQTLAELISANTLCDKLWNMVGACVKKFHDHGVYHADLNAKNILVTAQEKVYLIDFDRCCQTSKGRWQQQNLRRLNRSLQKIKNADNAHFSEQDWLALMTGYSESA